MNRPELSHATWRKSSYSGGNEGSCVEVAGVWRKSSHSGGNEGECVEVAAIPERLVAARDSKNPAGPVLCYGQREWSTFCAAIKSGSYDLARNR
ncbi:MAG TPA: DUF397 domain-containing protein [Streptosporangiaceae bacterium]